MQSTTAVCRHCAKRFNRRRHANRYQCAGGNLIASMAYCSPACRQAAYRVRKDIKAGIRASARRHRIGKRRLRPPSSSVTEAIKPSPVTDLTSSVTQPEILTRDQWAARGEKTALPLQRLLDIEVFVPHCWEHRISSGGVPIQVAQLRPSALLRRPPPLGPSPSSRTGEPTRRPFVPEDDHRIILYKIGISQIS
jgi:hypothetical protein